MPVQSLHLITPLHRRRARERAAAQARHRSVGAAHASAPPSRCATSPPSCSICMRAAARASGLKIAVASWSTRASPMPSRSRKPTIRPRRSAQVLADLQSDAPDGPHRLRRRRLRQDRSRHARRLRRRAGGQAGRRARARRRCSRSSIYQLPRPLRRLAGARRVAVAFRQVGTRDAGDLAGDRGRARSTSSSPRIACCTRTRASRISASSSSTKSTASACATRNDCRRCAPKCTCSR